ncbi:MAG: HNH endonuclease family protein [Caldilineaceae bacterium]|nr:HNH endonuclease family protein [Caldilineaceae bacterium]
MDTRATKAVLCAINEDDSRGEAPPFDELTVEHIMPQTLSKGWHKHLGAEADKLHEQYLHRLGNLTLCGPRWGSAMSNHPFEKKKKIYRQSSIMMTRQLAELATWDEDAIKGRADELAEKALRLWPRPSGL